jgi:SAM-dependent methyltransferase
VSLEPKSALRRAYRARQFDPRWAGLFINPFFLARRALWREIASAAGELRGPLLDVGCGSRPYEALFGAATRYVGVDVASDVTRQIGAADVLYDGRRLPFADRSFSSVLCNQVLEHVFEPDVFLSEIARVLAPGGRLLLTVPFVWDEHEQPHDFARYSSFGLRALLERNGMKVIRHRKLLADASVVFQLTNAYLFKVLRGSSPIWNAMVTAVVLAPVSLCGLVAGKLLPGNPDLFLDQLVLAERQA